MKKPVSLTLTILLISFLLNACFENKYAFLYNTFRGTYPQSEKANPDGTVENIPGDEITVRINNSSILINEENNKYRIATDSDGFLMLETEPVKGDSASVIRFKYLKDSGILVLIGKTENLNLMTEQMIHRIKLKSFAHFTLTSDISHLGSGDREMLKVLFKAADQMDEIFWMEAYGNREELMSSTQDSVILELFRINYGPWERLNNNRPLLRIYGNKPEGANFYPRDMTKQEFGELNDSLKQNQYSILKRDQDGKLFSIPYHVAFSKHVTVAAELLREAAELSENKEFGEYLKKRADALETDNYYASDTSWMKMKNNPVDFIAGPIENYEDALYNYKSAHEAYILIKDTLWSERLRHIASFLPALQRGLPVADEYKSEIPSGNSDLNVYDAVYYAGDCNAGSKTIAINLPNDPEVRKNYGSRKLQLKNTMQAKFENILVPISNLLVSESQRQYIDFDAFFSNTLFHEVAHGLGVDYTTNGKGYVREALKENYSAIEECKADIMGLYIASKLSQMGEAGNKNLMTNYVTFMAGTLRSVRFGAASAHGTANTMTFNYMEKAGAFIRNEESDTYSIDFRKMNNAIIRLMKDIIYIQANGDYEKGAALIQEQGSIKRQLQTDINRLNDFNIPVDIHLIQGPDKLGL